MDKYCVYCMNRNDGAVCSVCGRDSSAYIPLPHHLAPGTVLNGKYSVGAVLGEGGFGITYIGRDNVLDIPVAIKEYFPSGMVNRNNTASAEVATHGGAPVEDYEKGKRRFLDEARTLAQFSREASIVSVRDFFEENRTAYIVMEYVEGTDLKTYTDKNGALSFDQAVDLLSPVMSALDKLHAKGLIHRDISPANIMIRDDGTVTLLDFGAARSVSEGEDKSLSIILKPGFAPEEQYRTRGNQGPWTDVYALSATMYKIITGVTPEDAMNRLYKDELKNPCAYNLNVTAKQGEVILRGLSVRQEDRYQSVGDMLSACRQVYGKTAQQADDEKTLMLSDIVGKEQNTAVPPVYTPSKSVNIPKQVNTQNPVSTPKHVNTPKPVNTPNPVNKPNPANTPKADVNVGNEANRDGAKPKKKANIIFLIGAIVFGLLFLFVSSYSISDLIVGQASAWWILVDVLLLAATVVCGYFYFPRVDNKSKKPNIVCLVLHIISLLAAAFFAAGAYSLFSNSSTEKGLAEFTLFIAISFAIISAFCAYFFFPRLSRKKKKLAGRIYLGIVAAAVIALIVLVARTAMTTVSIGEDNIPKDVKTLSFYTELVTEGDLKKLSKLTKLESLTINACNITDEDIKTISELTWLKELNISNNPHVTDISPLASMESLQSLRITNTGVSDVSVIAGLSNLTSLYMASLDKLDRSTISLPASVRTLDISDDGIKDLSFLGNLDRLWSFYASNNQITDISPACFADIYSIEANDNKISDISALALTQISYLNLNNNNISNLSPLKSVDTLSSLELANNRITDISPLRDHYKISTLVLAGNKISDISVISTIDKLSVLDLSHNEITDISALAGKNLTSLYTFSLAYNKITDISPLAKLAASPEKISGSLHLENNAITNIDALRGFSNVTGIYLQHNKITDISALAGCTKATTVDVSYNNISDVSVIGNMASLSSLRAHSNPIKNFGTVKFAESKYSTWNTFSFDYVEGLDVGDFPKNCLLLIYNAPARAQDKIYETESRTHVHFLTYADDNAE